MVFQSVSKCFKVFHGVSRCIKVLQGVSGCIKVFQCFSRCFKDQYSILEIASPSIPIVDLAPNAFTVIVTDIVIPCVIKHNCTTELHQI